MCFISRNMQGKNNKRNSWIEVSDETIPKPKISELNDFQSILKVLRHPPFLNEEGYISGKWVMGQLNLGGGFLILSYHYNCHCFCILV